MQFLQASGKAEGAELSVSLYTRETGAVSQVWDHFVRRFAALSRMQR